MHCDEGYYADDSLGVCMKCPTTCTACISQQVCTECSKGYILLGQTCVPCERRKGFITESGFCKEICGDGLNFHVNQCDDGNLVDNDGCDKFCQVEAGWKCTGGSETTPDYCQRLSSVDVKVGTTTSDTVSFLWLNFTEPVQQLGSWEDTIKILRHPNLELVTNFKVEKVDDKSYRIQLIDYIPTEILHEFEIIIAKPSNLVDSSLNPVYFTPQKTTVDFSAYFSPIKKDVNSAALAAAGVFLGSTTVTLAISGGANFLWKLLDALQVFSFFALLAVEYPDFLNLIFDLMQIMNFSWLPNPFNKIATFFGTDPDPKPHSVPKKFEYNEFDSRFLFNSGQLLFTWAFFLLIALAVYYFKRKQGELGKNILNRLSTVFDIGTSIKMGLNIYFLVSIGCALNIRKLDFSDSFNVISSFLAILMQILLALVPAGIFEFLRRNSQNLQNPGFSSRYGALYMEYHQNHFLSRNFLVLNILGKSIYAMSLVYLYDTPFLQVFGVFISRLGISMVLLFVKPYKSKRDNLMELFNEGVSSITLCPIFMLALSKDAKNGFFGYLTIVLVCGMIAVNLIVALYEQILVYKEAIMRCAHQNRSKKEVVKVSPEMPRQKKKIIAPPEGARIMQYSSFRSTIKSRTLIVINKKHISK